MAAASQTDPTLYLKVSNIDYSIRSTQICCCISLLFQKPHLLNFYNHECVVYDTRGLTAVTVFESQFTWFCKISSCLGVSFENIRCRDICLRIGNVELGGTWFVGLQALASSSCSGCNRCASPLRYGRDHLLPIRDGKPTSLLLSCLWALTPQLTGLRMMKKDGDKLFWGNSETLLGRCTRIRLRCNLQSESWRSCDWIRMN